MNIKNMIEVLVLAFLALQLTACGGGGGSTGSAGGISGDIGSIGSDSEKSEDFVSPMEFWENSDIERTVIERNFPIYWGSNTNSLEGYYATSAYVSDSNIQDIVGGTFSTNVCLANQDNNRQTIDYTETIGGVDIAASGSFVTGTNSTFTIWQEVYVDADVLGGCELHNAAILSGTRLSSGDLELDALTVNLHQYNCDEYVVPEWYESEGYFMLTGSCSIGGGGVEDDHGDNISTATVVGLNSSTSGNIEVIGDEDFFRIDVSSEGTLLVYSSGNTDTFGYLLDSFGNILVPNDDDGVGLNFSLSYPVSVGTYYVRVRGFDVSMTTGNYSLEVSFETN